MSVNLLTVGDACANCCMSEGACPSCGTYWTGGFGYRVEWYGGVEALIRDMAAAAQKAGLRPGDIQVLRLNPFGAVE